MSEKTKQKIPYSGLFKIIEQFVFVLSIQTLALMIFWNAFIVSVFNEMKYSIDILSALYLIIAYKALTYSYLSAMNFNATSMMSNDLCLYIYEKRIKDQILENIVSKISSEQNKDSKEDSELSK